MELTFTCTKAYPIYKYGKSICYSCTVHVEELGLDLLGYKAFARPKGQKIEVIVKDPSETSFDYVTQKPVRIPNVSFSHPTHKLKLYKCIGDYVTEKHKSFEPPENFAKGFGHFLSKCFKRKEKECG